VVKAELEIDKASAKELEGKKVGVPIGTAAHYGFLKQMAHFGVDVSTMESSTWRPPTAPRPSRRAASTWSAAGAARCGA
jgi:taurine transport system substrate-binding protein